MSFRDFLRVVCRPRHKRTDHVCDRVNSASNMQEAASAALVDAISRALALENNVVAVDFRRRIQKAD